MTKRHTRARLGSHGMANVRIASAKARAETAQAALAVVAPVADATAAKAAVVATAARQGGGRSGGRNGSPRNYPAKRQRPNFPGNLESQPAMPKLRRLWSRRDAVAVCCSLADCYCPCPARCAAAVDGPVQVLAVLLAPPAPEGPADMPRTLVLCLGNAIGVKLGCVSLGVLFPQSFVG